MQCDSFWLLLGELMTSVCMFVCTYIVLVCRHMVSQWFTQLNSSHVYMYACTYTYTCTCTCIIYVYVYVHVHIILYERVVCLRSASRCWLGPIHAKLELSCTCTYLFISNMHVHCTLHMAHVCQSYFSGLELISGRLFVKVILMNLWHHFLSTQIRIKTCNRRTERERERDLVPNPLK